MVPLPLTMTASSAMAGTYAPPAVQEPSTTASCGTPIADIFACSGAQRVGGRALAHGARVGMTPGAKCVRRGSLTWLKKMRPKCSRSGKTSAWRGRLAPPESTCQAREVGRQWAHRAFPRTGRGRRAANQVDARQPILRRNFLRAQVLLDSDRVVGAALDGRVIRDNHADPACNRADACDDSAGRDVLIAVEIVPGEL